MDIIKRAEDWLETSKLVDIDENEESWKIISDLLTLLKEREWKPIEQLPDKYKKNQSNLLLRKWNNTWVGCWIVEKELYDGGRTIKSGWYSEGMYTAPPTHYMELPPLPKK